MSNFTVRLQVTDADGCYTYIDKIISVKNKPYLNFVDTENPFSPFKHCQEIIIDPAFDVVLENRSQNTSCIQVIKLTGRWECN